MGRHERCDARDFVSAQPHGDLRGTGAYTGYCRQLGKKRPGLPGRESPNQRVQPTGAARRGLR